MYCERQQLLPTGLSDKPDESKVRLYCAKCQDIYSPSAKKYKEVDGCFFGTSFPEMFIINYASWFKNLKKKPYIAIVNGFKVHSTSITRPPKIVYRYTANSLEIIPRPLPEFSNSSDEKYKSRVFIVNDDSDDY